MNSNNQNPNSLKFRFTKNFLRSLSKINKQKPVVPCCPRVIFQRCNKVKTAANKSLASAVGSRRAWSRALLSKIRNRTRKPWCRHHRLIKVHRPVRIHFPTHPPVKRINVKIHNTAAEKISRLDGANKLRKVVPGGEGMELCSLLDETAHYIKCLNTQVQVMRCIADLCHTTNT